MHKEFEFAGLVSANLKCYIFLKLSYFLYLLVRCFDVLQQSSVTGLFHFVRSAAENTVILYRAWDIFHTRFFGLEKYVFSRKLIVAKSRIFFSFAIFQYSRKRPGRIGVDFRQSVRGTEIF